MLQTKTNTEARHVPVDMACFSLKMSVAVSCLIVFESTKGYAGESRVSVPLVLGWINSVCMEQESAATGIQQAAASLVAVESGGLE